jgi:integrase
VKRPTGSIQKLGPGKKQGEFRWNVQVPYYVPRPDGKPKEKRLSKRMEGTRRDAEIVKGELFRKLDNTEKVGVAVEPSMTFGAFLEVQWIPFLYSKVAEDGSPATPATLERRLRLHVLPYPIAQVPCCEMDCLKMDQWMKALRAARPDLKERSLSNILDAVRTPCRQAVAWRLMTHDPLIGMANKPHPRAYQAYDIPLGEANQLMGAFWEHSLGLPFALVLGVGLRPGEVCALRWRDFDFEAMTLRVSRNVTTGGRGAKPTECRAKSEGSSGVVPIPQQLMPLVRKYRLTRMEANLALGNPDALLVTSPSGGLRDPGVLSRAFQQLRTALGLPYMRLYDQRHAMINLAIDAGVSVFDASKMARHSRVATTTQFYAKDSKSRRRANADVVGNLLLPSGEARG